MSGLLDRFGKTILGVFSALLILCTVTPIVAAASSEEDILRSAKVIGNMTANELLALITICSVLGMLGLFWLREKTAKQERAENLELTRQNAALSQQALDALKQNTEAIQHCQAAQLAALNKQ